MISRSKQAVQSVTTLQLSPEEDRHARMVKYVVAMSTRTVCFILAIFVPGWGHLIFGLVAMVLPYFAVVVANAGATGAQQPVGVTPQIREIEALSATSSR